MDIVTESNVDARANVVTPSYILDIETLYKKIDLMREKLGKDYKICFAMKANPYLVQYIKDKVDRLEVCSLGEYKICIKNNIDADKIVVSGVNKTYESMKEIMDYSGGKGIYTIESEKHLEIFEKVAEEYNLNLEVIVRLSSGNQFGVDKDTLESILNSILSNSRLSMVGIHYYSGTQKKIKKIEKELVMLDDYFDYIKEKYGIDSLELEYGPSLITRYFENDTVTDELEQLEQLCDLLDALECVKLVTLEFGRFIASSCGSYITKVEDVKVNDGHGYIIVDGGIHQVNFYGQMMGMKKPFISVVKQRRDIDVDKEDINYTVCGSLCTVNDVLIREVSLKDIHVEDKIIFHNVGAYSLTEGIALFLTRELPQIYVRSVDGSISVLREMIQIADMKVHY